MRRLAITLAVLVIGISGAAARASPLSQLGLTTPLSHSGRFLTDSSGRVIVVHGVNMVYKLPPYYPAAAGFNSEDAAFLHSLGMNAVRVGVIWKAVEPRRGVYDDAYLEQIAQTVSTLWAHGIYSLLDFHQDMYNERFQGEGAPDWAVPDEALPAIPRLGFPLNYELMPALDIAYDDFWANLDGLQNDYAAAWAHVAGRFDGLPGVLGYELFNEPFPGLGYLGCVLPGGCPAFDAKLTAFDRRVARAIRAVDQQTMIFYEPNVLFDYGYPTHVGALDDPQAGFAFHDYCFSFSATGCKSETTGFANALGHVRATGEALLLTEFGSTKGAADLTGMVARADHDMVPWLEWSYCPCGDPTGATPDPFVLNPAEPPTGANVGQLALHTLVEPYPQAIAGTPESWGFDRATDTFTMQYSTARSGERGRFHRGALTEVAVPRLPYPSGYRVRVKGGRVVSRRGAVILRIAERRRASAVSVTVTPR